MAKPLVIGGEKGDAAFTEPFIEWSQAEQDLPGFLKRIKATGDDRSFTILTAVVVERYAEELLTSLAPSFADKANLGFTFSQKLQILRALQLIPPHIIRAADLIRKIRNDFAHNINTEVFSGKFSQQLEQARRDAFGASDKPSSEREDFEEVAFIALVGLQAYRPNFKKIREKLSDEKTISEWKSECHQEFLKRLKIIHSGEPISVEVKDGWKYTHYREGLVHVEAENPGSAPATIDVDVAQLHIGREQSDPESSDREATET
jgi:hypothetical protein